MIFIFIFLFFLFLYWATFPVGEFGLFDFFARSLGFSVTCNDNHN